jgi:hypothetical protein
VPYSLQDTPNGYRLVGERERLDVQLWLINESQVSFEFPPDIENLIALRFESATFTGPIDVVDRKANRLFSTTIQRLRQMARDRQ